MKNVHEKDKEYNSKQHQNQHNVQGNSNQRENSKDL